MKKMYEYAMRFVGYLRRTWLMKLGVIAFVSLMMIPTVLTKDATALVFVLVFGIPMFFMDMKNVETEEEF